MRSLLTFFLYVFVNRSLGTLVYNKTTLRPKTASEVTYLYEKYLRELAANKSIAKLKEELSISGSISVGDLSDLSLQIVETPVFYDDDDNVAFNVELVKGNEKHMNVDKNVKRLYISVPNPDNKEKTDKFLQKYMSKVLGVTSGCINITDITDNKKLIYVPQKEIKASDAIDKVVSSLSKGVLVNESHALTKNLQNLYETLIDVPNKQPSRESSLPTNVISSQLTTEKIPLNKMLRINTRKVSNISKVIQIVTDDKGNIVFTVDIIKGHCNRILDIQASLLRIQILAPDYVSAEEAELTRYLSGVFMISRRDILLEHIQGSEKVKILLRKHAIHPQNAVKKLADEYESDDSGC